MEPAVNPKPVPRSQPRAAVRLTLTCPNVRVTLTVMTSSGTQAPAATRTESVSCSFCTKDQHAVAKLIAGHGIYICNECVGLCDQILADQPASEFGSWSERPDEEMLTGLARMQAITSQVDAAIHDHVGILRARGISWTRIGDALGVSKQSAWERFSGED